MPTVYKKNGHSRINFDLNFIIFETLDCEYDQQNHYQ